MVDGDARRRADIRILLAKGNYRVIEVGTCPRAMAKLTGQVDLVILDLLLPELSGVRDDPSLFHRPQSVPRPTGKENRTRSVGRPG